MTRAGIACGLLSVVGLLAGCGSDAAPEASSESSSKEASDEVPGAAADSALFPDVVAAELEANDDGTFDVAVTVSSPYDTPERYADAWRVLGPGGEEYGVRILTHDHANEQPFTRSLRGVEIPEGVEQVTIEGRDLENGWGGATVTVEVPHP